MNKVGSKDIETIIRHMGQKKRDYDNQFERNNLLGAADAAEDWGMSVFASGDYTVISKALHLLLKKVSEDEHRDNTLFERMKKKAEEDGW